MVDETTPDPQMPKATPQKNEGNTHWATLGDIRTAYRRTGLTGEERRALFLIGNLGLKQGSAARQEGQPRTTIQSRYDSAIGKLLDTLNGTDIYEEENE